MPGTELMLRVPQYLKQVSSLSSQSLLSWDNVSQSIQCSDAYV